jgi:hypothetical protein
MTKELKTYYYDKSHILWTGQEAIDELTLFLKGGKKALRKVRKFLGTQAIFQIHIPQPKNVDHPHYMVDTPNALGIVDLVTMPADKLHGNIYKYLEVYVDVASGFIQIRPLRKKAVKETTFAMKDMLKVVHPKEMYADKGTEFKADFKKLLIEQDIEFKTEITKYWHGFTGPVDVIIRNFVIRMFRRMDAQELLTPDEVSTIYVKFIQQGVDYHNNRINPRIGMTPAQAFKLDKIIPKKPRKYRKEKIMPTTGLYRYLLKPGEEHGDSRRRATDNFWSRKTYRLSTIAEDPGQRVIYHLEDGPERPFVREELMLIPENTELPPESIKKW